MAKWLIICLRTTDLTRLGMPSSAHAPCGILDVHSGKLGTAQPVCLICEKLRRRVFLEAVRCVLIGQVALFHATLLPFALGLRLNDSKPSQGDICLLRSLINQRAASAKAHGVCVRAMGERPHRLTMDNKDRVYNCPFTFLPDEEHRQLSPGRRGKLRIAGTLL